MRKNKNESPTKRSISQPHKTNLIFESKIKIHNEKIGYHSQAYQIKSLNDEFSPSGKSPLHKSNFNKEDSIINTEPQISKHKMLKYITQN